MNSKIKSLEGELDNVKANVISVETKVKEVPSKEKETKNAYLALCQHQGFYTLPSFSLWFSGS